MSIDSCEVCGDAVDTDEDTYCYDPDEKFWTGSVTCRCERCREKAYDRAQERLMEDGPAVSNHDQQLRDLAAVIW